MTKTFYQEWYGISNVEESRQRIVATGMKHAPASPLLLMAHNGPTGLGSKRFNICGVDWTDKAGDHGDEDLELALSDLHSLGGKLRQMVAVDPLHSTVYLNAATVPRIRRSGQRDKSGTDTGGTYGLHQHHYLVVEMKGGEVDSAKDVWCEVVPPPGSDHSQQRWVTSQWTPWTSKKAEAESAVCAAN
eukprot:gene30602-35614_t